ncbi:MAG: hypothetical protein KatS3mg043_0414 [Rhodothermaceae bacterium]|nr:MAG: hypothetical protein KatS3mg043_0414 [Rhodothermaceae bacterium]
MDTNQRPPFTTDLSVEEFRAHYWYKQELAALCRQHGLPASGTKAELEERLVQLLTGTAKPAASRTRATQLRRKATNQPITLATRLIPGGFKFNQEAREFFQNYYGVKKFSFTKEMAAALREAEARGDYAMTVADLIAVYESSRIRGKDRVMPETAEEKTYQWNAFVRDFHADPRTKAWNNKMEIAAFLWRKVRDRKGAKRYDTALLDEFREQIAEMERADKAWG